MRASTAPVRRHDHLPGFVGLFEAFRIAANRMVEANDCQFTGPSHVQNLFVVVNRICIYVFELPRNFFGRSVGQIQYRNVVIRSGVRCHYETVIDCLDVKVLSITAGHSPGTQLPEMGRVTGIKD
jgi:hypothetical protein